MKRALKRAIKYCVSAMFSVALLSAVLPPPAANAAVRILSVDLGANSSHLIGGYHYQATIYTDKASGTVLKSVKAEYSSDNGVTWWPLGGFWVANNSDAEVTQFFTLPIDSGLTSVMLRFHFHFSPLIGSDSYPVYTTKPMQVLQPGDPSDLTASANNDGTVTLQWYDNTNMESYYQIFRDGPDGTKSFIARNTAGPIGWITFTDKETNTGKSTFYGYTVSPVIDSFTLPNDLMPAKVYALVKTNPLSASMNLWKVQLQPDLSNAIVNTQPEIPKDVIYKDDSGNLSSFLDKWGVLVPDADKVQVSGVTLDKKAISLPVGDSEQLTASVVPSDAANRNVAWSSSDNSVAVVDSTGKVTGVSLGSANITVKTEAGGFAKVCVVSVSGKMKPEPVAQFTDTAGHWAEPYIAQAVAKGVVNGYTDGTFRPDGTVTRAELAVMLINALKPDAELIELSFKDKDSIGIWAIQKVSQAVNLGIIRGYPDGTFRPKANITHAEMISMVFRAARLPAADNVATSFKDDAKIPSWAKPAVAALEKNGIIVVNGLADRLFEPSAVSTRAEAAATIVKLLEAKGR